MPQNSFNLNARAALLAAVASAYPVIGYCAPAAQVDFAVGDEIGRRRVGKECCR